MGFRVRIAVHDVEPAPVTNAGSIANGEAPADVGVARRVEHGRRIVLDDLRLRQHSS